LAEQVALAVFAGGPHRNATHGAPAGFGLFGSPGPAGFRVNDGGLAG